MKAIASYLLYDYRVAKNALPRIGYIITAVR